MRRATKGMLGPQVPKCREESGATRCLSNARYIEEWLETGALVKRIASLWKQTMMILTTIIMQ